MARSATDFRLPIAARLSELLLGLRKLIFTCKCMAMSVQMDDKARQIQRHGFTPLQLITTSTMQCVSQCIRTQGEGMCESTPTLDMHRYTTSMCVDARHGLLSAIGLFNHVEDSTSPELPHDCSQSRPCTSLERLLASRL